MIFLTIGTQEPFDRLIKTVDNLAGQYKNYRFVAQVNSSKYEIKNMEYFDFISPHEFDHIFKESKLIISHAGMGTIISALTNKKPLIIMPRLANLGEHRNDHQIATAKKIKELGYVYVALDEAELAANINNLLTQSEIPIKKEIGSFASEKLTSSIRNYLDEI